MDKPKYICKRCKNNRFGLWYKDTPRPLHICTYCFKCYDVSEYEELRDISGDTEKVKPERNPWGELELPENPPLF